MKWTAEDDERLLPLIEEADRDEGYITNEEFWQRVEKLKEEERREKKYRIAARMKNAKLYIKINIGKISKRFIKA